jgi:hypothetical protein
MTRVKLPACQACNYVLAKRFEEPTKAILRKLFACDGTMGLSASGTHDVALWFMKTWLLLSHPDVVYSDARIDVHAVRWDSPAPADFYEWMVEDRPPPPGLSLWIYRPMANDESTADSASVIPLPVVEADGRTVDYAWLPFTASTSAWSCILDGKSTTLLKLTDELSDSGPAPSPSHSTSRLSLLSP